MGKDSDLRSQFINCPSPLLKGLTLALNSTEGLEGSNLQNPHKAPGNYFEIQKWQSQGSKQSRGKIHQLLVHRKKGSHPQRKHSQLPLC